MSNKPKPRRAQTDFGKPPKAYVPGAGRGAVGFTTRSDIGPARQAVVPIDRSISAQKERARQVLLQRQLGGTGVVPTTKEEDLSESNYDQFSGYTAALFATANYDDEDLEADNIFEAVDTRMDSKRKRRRDHRQRAELEEYHRKRPKVSEMFHKEKVQLAQFDDSIWSNIPNAADLTRRPKSTSRSEKFTPVPDSVYENARRGLHTSGSATAVDMRESRRGGWETRVGFATNVHGTTTTDLTNLGRARDRHLAIQLDTMADSVTGQTVVDPRGYLTDLTSFSITSDTDISDIRKARKLLESVVKSNPSHPPGWIAAARLEEAAGKIQAARVVILRGTDACAASQDIWLEAARLHNVREAKAILARAVRHIPSSVKIWLKAAQLEKDKADKKSVLRRGLELIPNSVSLWKQAVELEEDPVEAHVLLTRAVDCVPQSVELWLALARLSDYKNAQKVLNRARALVPTDPSIWIAAAKLEERTMRKAMKEEPESVDAERTVQKIDIIISKSVSSLREYNVLIDRDSWLQEAAKCEKSECPHTCQAIVRHTIGSGIEEQDERETWKNDATNWIAKNQVVLARAIYDHMLSRYSHRWQNWWDAAALERKHGTPDLCVAVLERGVEACPHATQLWLFLARETWQTLRNADGARSVIQNALRLNPNNEKIWLAAVKIESENGFHDIAKDLLDRAREECDTPKVWMHSALLERRRGDTQAEENLLNDGTRKFPDFDKLWMMLAQLYERCGDIIRARQTCQVGTKECGNSSVPLWLEYARIEEASGRIAKARSVLENARLKIPQNEDLWCAAVKLEHNHGGNSVRSLEIAKTLLARGLQECPDSGILWSLTIELEPQATRKSKCVAAIKRCNNSPRVFLSVAKFFWLKRKVKQCRDWFERAISNGQELGDIYAYYLKFEQQYGSQETQNNVISRCVEAQPKLGDLWIEVSKKVGNESMNTQEILHHITDNKISFQ